MSHPAAILAAGTNVILARVNRPEFKGKRGVIVKYIKRHQVYRVRLTAPPTMPNRTTSTYWRSHD